MQCPELITVILHLVLYGCETGSLTARKEHKIVSQNKVFRRIVEPKKKEVKGGQRKQHD
jgi:hypothetical protein